ncbi:sialate O-acetylesterase [Lactobacillus corticis]|uniref:Sialate O-acetylesterase domain-containing protein n=1 Tax=Lactobacillus corticis TaxID=2201249 RepID=A0A916QHF2_9LACO|nr:sialate O-acetylesterase [Lactobacillus corticis]GFZ27379.1 hypothetical protein LCB40_12590 [Lactobacillus corticis]
MLKSAIVFGDNMVLQRQKKIHIWGEGDTGKNVTVSLIGDKTVSASTEVKKDGTWELDLPEQEAARNLVLKITNGETTLTYKDVSIGEVWIAGGQSNMEYFLAYDAEKKSVLNGPMNPDIHFFDTPKVSYEGQITEHDYSAYGYWRSCTKKDLPNFSAVCYYFAAKLQKTLEVPVGVVACDWNGTPACTWTDPEELKKGAGKAWIDSYELNVSALDNDEYKEAFRKNPLNNRSNPLKDLPAPAKKIFYPGMGEKEQKLLLKVVPPDKLSFMGGEELGPFDERRPGALYKFMLKTIAPFTARGFIYYQGESDEKRASIYGDVMKALITSWRKLWNEEMPFLFVQLAPFGEMLGTTGVHFPEVRRQQEKVSKDVANTYMISTSDAGMYWDVHPKHKRVVGERLALMATGKIYGEDILCEAPEFVEAKRTSEGIDLYFANADGLKIKGEKVNDLTVTDAYIQEVEVKQFDISENVLHLIGDFPESVTITFATTPYYEVNLYNAAEIPAKPFMVKI